jgi:hypothetical protein
MWVLDDRKRDEYIYIYIYKGSCVRIEMKHIATSNSWIAKSKKPNI